MTRRFCIGLLPLLAATLHCHAPSTEARNSAAGQADTINGASTGAFDREFTPTGYSAISATVSIPSYAGPTDGSQGEPYVYYIITDDLGSIAMEAGLAYQHGLGSSPPPRWRPYLRGAGPGNSNAMQFAPETYSIPPGTTVTLAATFDGSTVRIKVNGAVATSEGLVGLAPADAHVARVVSNAVSGSYGGGALAQVGPVVFSGTTVWTPDGSSTSFDDVQGWSTTSGGRVFGTSQYPASMIAIARTVSTDTITLFPGVPAASGGDTAAPPSAGGEDAGGDASNTQDDAADAAAYPDDVVAYQDDASADATAPNQAPSCDQLADGTYCGGDGIDGGDPSTLYSCASGVLAVVEVCEYGCQGSGGSTDSCN